jgi:hypothetical protein
MAEKQRNEGEGNKTADRQYRKHTEEFVKSGKVSEAAEDAREAFEGDEKAELKRAEKAGVKRGRH